MKKKTKKLYVAYGSNLHLEQMAHRCPDAKIYGAGVIKNYALTFLGVGHRGGVATILPHKGTDVPVGLWEVSENDERNLDVYEGFPRLYRKENIDVVMEDGSVVTGMVYIMNYGVPSEPSDYYYFVIASGYRSFGFDLKFLEESKKNIKKIAEYDHSFSHRA